MATVRISEAEAARDFLAVLARVEAGEEVVIEKNALAVAIVSPAKKPGLLISEILERARARGSTATLDGGFERDLEDVINSHPEPIDLSWD
jgi:antitoxin (DNA-binding transcriptional repressor) of toxin-antitoxin stability system